MISSDSVDLTERRDFGARITLLQGHILPINLNHMSSEEYDNLRRWEKIFGRRFHDDQRIKIFDITPFIKNHEEHCDRCGKYLAIPWKRPNSGLCEECERQIKIYSSFSRIIPWKQINYTNGPEQDVKYDLFNRK